MILSMWLHPHYQDETVTEAKPTGYQRATVIGVGGGLWSKQLWCISDFVVKAGKESLCLLSEKNKKRPFLRAISNHLRIKVGQRKKKNWHLERRAVTQRRNVLGSSILFWSCWVGFYGSSASPSTLPPHPRPTSIFKTETAQPPLLFKPLWLALPTYKLKYTDTERIETWLQKLFSS